MYYLLNSLLGPPPGSQPWNIHIVIDLDKFTEKGQVKVAKYPQSTRHSTLSIGLLKGNQKVLARRKAACTTVTRFISESLKDTWKKRADGAIMSGNYVELWAKIGGYVDIIPWAQSQVDDMPGLLCERFGLGGGRNTRFTEAKIL